MITNTEALADYLERSVRSFTDVAIVGISGGVDSAVVSSIAVAALGAGNVYVVSMPYGETDLRTFNQRSSELAEQLGAHHLMVSIGEATDSLMKDFGKALEDESGSWGALHKLTSGNTRARMRMATLYALAGELSYRLNPAQKPDSLVNTQVLPPKRVRVLGTGNASEDLIGYDTKGGDALADLFVIGDLFKSEVFQLAAHYRVPRSIVEAAPSAGLYEGQTDTQELGYRYEELEPALESLHRVLRKGLKDSEISPTLPEFSSVDSATAHFVVSRFLAHAHKHRAPSVIPVRETEYVKDIWEEHDSSEGS